MFWFSWPDFNLNQKISQMIRIKITLTTNLVQRFNLILSVYLRDGMSSNYTRSIAIISIFIIFVLFLCYWKQLHILAKIVQTSKQSTGPIPFQLNILKTPHYMQHLADQIYKKTSTVVKSSSSESRSFSNMQFHKLHHSLCAIFNSRGN